MVPVNDLLDKVCDRTMVVAGIVANQAVPGKAAGGYTQNIAVLGQALLQYISKQIASLKPFYSVPGSTFDRIMYNLNHLSVLPHML